MGNDSKKFGDDYEEEITNAVPKTEDSDEGDIVEVSHCPCWGKCQAPRSKTKSFNWLDDIPGETKDFDIVEVSFKNTRKGFYRITNNLELHKGDVVAVEATSGHDIGTVTMTGRLVALQMKRANLRKDYEILRVFRLAKPSDLEKFDIAKAKENDTMIRSRKIAEDLGLDMKIGDVEYQGDGNKAIFYYIADEHVDFRQLIKVLAETFKIRVEMKQIGARQEAGRIGGIGPCGRPLCCSSWMGNFVSVSTSAARIQDISLNPQKLAGQCAKLKCCLNFEVDAYVESSKRLPSKDIQLYTQDETYYFFKADILKRQVTYSTQKNVPVNLVTIDANHAFDIIEMNKQGEKPETLLESGASSEKRKLQEYGDIIGENSLTRFDKKNKKNNRSRHNSKSKKESSNNVAEKTDGASSERSQTARRVNNGNSNKSNSRNSENGRRHHQTKNESKNTPKGPQQQ